MAAALALVLLLAVYFTFVWQPFVQALRRFSARGRFHGLWLAAALLIPFTLAALSLAVKDPAVALWGILRMSVYVLLPTLLLLLRPPERPALDLFDLLAILAVWLPVELDWLPDLSASIGGAQVPLALLTAIGLGLLLYLVVRPLDRIGYTYRLSFRDLGTAVLGLVVFMLAGLPLGILTGFIRPGAAVFELSNWLMAFLAIYFLNALPEELLFRGILQNLLEMRYGRTGWTLVASAILFGLTHLNNVTAHHFPPNWPYALMAALAGLAYGWVWRRSEKVTASAVTHTLVNFTWSVLFRG